MLVVSWVDATIAGPWIQFLAAVSDMGEARRLASTAATPAPSQDDHLERKDPLYAVATGHPGILLWRYDEDPNHAGGFEDEPWHAGADEARRFRLADAARYNDVQQAARERRKHRRQGSAVRTRRRRKLPLEDVAADGRVRAATS